MCGTDPCLALYADDAVRGAALDRVARRCGGGETTVRGAVALAVSQRPGRVRFEARLLSGAGIILELSPAAARSLGACLEAAAGYVDAAPPAAEGSDGPAASLARPASLRSIG